MTHENNCECPVFSIGDLVEFELIAGGDTPRWNYNIDFDGSGVWATGRVVDISPSLLTVLTGDLRWNWPMHASPVYMNSQWTRPGWVRHVNRQLGQDSMQATTIEAVTLALPFERSPTLTRNAQCFLCGGVAADARCEYSKTPLYAHLDCVRRARG